MDFQVQIIGEEEAQLFEQFHDALRYIEQKMAYWNNFEPDKLLDITVIKVQSDTETLGVSANDAINLKDIMR